MFIGLANNEIKDSPVNAADVSRTLPVELATMTKTMNVANGAIAVVLFAVKLSAYLNIVSYLETRTKKDTN